MKIGNYRHECKAQIHICMSVWKKERKISLRNKHSDVTGGIQRDTSKGKKNGVFGMFLWAVDEDGLVRLRRAGTRSWRGWFEKFSHFSTNLTPRDWWHTDQERQTSQSQLLKQIIQCARLWSLVIVSFGNQAKRGQAYNKTEKTSDSQTLARRSRARNCLKTRITYKRWWPKL